MSKKERIQEKLNFHLNDNGKKLETSSFENKLFDTIFTADIKNINKIHQAYPDYVEVVAEYKGIDHLIERDIEIPDEIKKINEYQYDKMLDSGEPKGKFFMTEDDMFIAIDNSGEEMFVEDFDKLGDCIDYLQGKEIEQIKDFSRDNSSKELDFNKNVEILNDFDNVESFYMTYIEYSGEEGGLWLDNTREIKKQLAKHGIPEDTKSIEVNFVDETGARNIELFGEGEVRYIQENDIDLSENLKFNFTEYVDEVSEGKGVMIQGKGTKEKPYLIKNKDQLKEIGNILSEDSHYKLMNDIDFEGEEIKPISNLTDEFDGQEHTIKNMKIKKSIEKNVGLFRENLGVIKNLNFKNINITGYENTGGIVGLNSGEIKNCKISGNIKGNYNTGGIAGCNSGKIQNCFTDGKIKGQIKAGGITGYNNGEIKNSYTKDQLENRLETSKSLEEYKASIKEGLELADDPKKIKKAESELKEVEQKLKDLDKTKIKDKLNNLDMKEKVKSTPVMER